MFALGGYDGGGQLATVESLDTQTGVSPPPPRTKWTRRVPHPVLIGHAVRKNLSRRVAYRSADALQARRARRRGACLLHRPHAPPPATSASAAAIVIASAMIITIVVMKMVTIILHDHWS